MFRKTVGLLVLASVLAGCRSQPEQPLEPPKEFEGKQVVIKLTTGDEITGTVMVESETEIFIKGDEGNAALPRTMILSIREYSEPKGRLRLPGEDLLKARPVVRYVAKQGSGIFHRPDCKLLRGVSSSKRITFSSREEATRRGLRPCGMCNP